MLEVVLMVEQDLLEGQDKVKWVVVLEVEVVAQEDQVKAQELEWLVKVTIVSSIKCEKDLNFNHYLWRNK